MGTFKSLRIVAMTAAALLVAASAEARVSWSIDIATPLVGTAVTNAPDYGRPAYVQRIYTRPVYARPGYAVPQFGAVPAAAYAPQSYIREPYARLPYASVPARIVRPPALVYAPVPVYGPGYVAGYPARRWHRHGLRPAPWVVGAPAYEVRGW